MKIDLNNQNILVTGASRGIGKEIARMLAEAGAGVGIHYHRQKDAAQALQAELGPKSHIFQANLGEVAACVDLFEKATTHFGHIHALINNAGIVVPVEENATIPEFMAAWQQTLQVNLVAAGLLSHLFREHFVSQGGGRFIHIASRAAFRGDTAEYMAYAASKGGMVALSKSIARAYGKQGIKSFVIAPGFTRTDMAREFIDTYGEEIVLNDLALNTLTSPKDVAPTVVFLCSGHMDHATGCSIDINAGSYVR